MSAERYEIINDGLAEVAIKLGDSTLYFDDDDDEFAVGAIRQQSADIASLRAELAAAVAERDRIKGDHDEAAHFARHFIRDDPNITPRGAIIRLGDKCTDLFVRLQQAEARLAAIDAAPVVAWQDKSWRQDLYHRRPDPAQVDTRELIAKPAKD